MLDPGRGESYNNSVEDESGMCSPPLWTATPPRSPHHHRKNHYRSLSPESKTQAIARGQRELMEMVRNMPEANYELTLKDLVENKEQAQAQTQAKVVVEEKNRVGEKKKGNKREVARKIHEKRNGGNIDSGGFYLKMVFPISLGSKSNKNKKKDCLANNNSSSSKVSPRTSVSDKEWWKKKSSVSESEGINSGSMKSSRSSSCHSSCSSRSNSRHEMSASNCWPFIRR